MDELERMCQHLRDTGYPGRFADDVIDHAIYGDRVVAVFERGWKHTVPLADLPAPKPVEIDATGAAERLAAERGINLLDVQGTGEDGRVLIGDVRSALGDNDG